MTINRKMDLEVALMAPEVTTQIIEGPIEITLEAGEITVEITLESVDLAT